MQTAPQHFYLTSDVKYWGFSSGQLETWGHSVSCLAEPHVLCRRDRRGTITYEYTLDLMATDQGGTSLHLVTVSRTPAPQSRICPRIERVHMLRHHRIAASLPYADSRAASFSPQLTPKVGGEGGRLYRSRAFFRRPGRMRGGLLYRPIPYEVRSPAKQARI